MAVVYSFYFKQKTSLFHEIITCLSMKQHAVIFINIVSSLKTCRIFCSSGFPRCVKRGTPRWISHLTLTFHSSFYEIWINEMKSLHRRVKTHVPPLAKPAAAVSRSPRLEDVPLPPSSVHLFKKRFFPLVFAPDLLWQTNEGRHQAFWLDEWGKHLVSLFYFWGFAAFG